MTTRKLIANAWLWLLVGAVVVALFGIIIPCFIQLLIDDSEARYTVLGFAGFFAFLGLTRWAIDVVDEPDPAREGESKNEDIN